MNAKFVSLLLSSVLLAGSELAHAQTTAFTYQGRLTANGNPADGNYDLLFTLYSAASGGNQVGNALTNSSVVVANGLFTTMLDFGPGVFNGANLWLEVGVRTNASTNAFTALSPLQPLTPAPYAITASNLSGTLPAAQLSGALPSGALSGAFGSAVALNNASNSFVGGFTGNGGGLTNLAAASLVGRIPDAKLSTNVALLDLSNTATQATAMPVITSGFITSANVTSGGFGYSTPPAITISDPTGSNAVITATLSNGIVVSLTVQDAGIHYSAGAILTIAPPPSNAYQTFRANNVFSGVNTMTNPNNSFVGYFTGNASGLTNLSVPGVLVWQTVTGTSVQLLGNASYLLTSALPTTLTLPASPNLGDIVRVSGVGAGGWQIAQNAAQSILTDGFASTVNLYWSSVASSADGSKLVAAATPGRIYASTNSGATWAPTSAPTRWWRAVASSSDGNKLAAVENEGLIYASTNSGATWVPTTAPVGSWISIASSSDGTRLVAASTYTNAIYTSADSGTNWTQRISAPSNSRWASVASSSDGSKLVAVTSYGGVYTSVNSGANWTQQTSAPSNAYWSSVASSADGSKLVGVAYYGGVYTSVNSGANWTQQTSAPSNARWQSVASSVDGSKLVAVASYWGDGLIDISNPSVYINGGVYTSANSGATWVQTAAPAQEWKSVACSSDGNKFVALGAGNARYASQGNPQTATTIGTSGYLTGGQSSAIELQYIGNGQFMPLSYAGAIVAY